MNNYVPLFIITNEMLDRNSSIMKKIDNGLVKMSYLDTPTNKNQIYYKQ